MRDRDIIASQLPGSEAQIEALRAIDAGFDETCSDFEDLYREMEGLASTDDDQSKYPGYAATMETMAGLREEIELALRRPKENQRD